MRPSAHSQSVPHVARPALLVVAVLAAVVLLAGLVARVVVVAAVARVGVLAALVVVVVATAIARLAGRRLLVVLRCVGRRRALQVLDVRLGLPLEDLVPPSVDGRVHHQSRSRCRSHREEAGICHVTGPAHLRAGEEPAAELDDVDSHAEVVAQLMRVPHARRRWS